MDLLYAENVSVSFDGFKALDIDEFEVKQGELRVIIGPNGAGKTTFLDVICGKTKADTGHIMMNNENLFNMTEKQIVEYGVGRKFQNPTVFNSLSVFENLYLAYKTNKSVWSSLFYTRKGEEMDRIKDVANTIGLIDSLDREAGQMSHGQKQWLEIGMVILQDPQLMLIDEPAAGMTDEETYKTGELLIKLAEHRTIIVIEHDMEFVRQIAQIVTVFAEGKKLVEGPFAEVEKDPQVIECYLGKPDHD